MERLLQVFQRLSDNQDLIRRLQAFKKERNYLAHRAANDYFASHDAEPKKHRIMMTRLTKLENEGNALVKELYTETCRTREVGKAQSPRF